MNKGLLQNVCQILSGGLIIFFTAEAGRAGRYAELHCCMMLLTILSIYHTIILSLRTLQQYSLQKQIRKTEIDDEPRNIHQRGHKGRGRYGRVSAEFFEEDGQHGTGEGTP